MCLITVGKTKDILNLDLKSAWDSNPHGAGIIIPGKKNRDIIIKGIMTKKDLITHLERIHGNKTIALHLRLATHGKPSISNSHPHKVDRNTYLMHNGILNHLGESGDKGRSDSAHLASILSLLSHHDRLAILKSVSGKYCMLANSNLYLIGDFIEYKNTTCSNTYWSFPTQAMGFKLNQSCDLSSRSITAKAKSDNDYVSDNWWKDLRYQDEI